MKSPIKSLNSTQPTPLVSLFAVVTTIIAAVFVYQKYFGTDFFDFGPIMIWLGIAIPAGLFGAVFLQVRANQRAQASRQTPANLGEAPVNPRVSENPRTMIAKPGLNRPLPDEDPFENL
jgi:hypothetical protein